VKTINVNGFEVAGNAFLAIAINDDDPTDAHWFLPGDPDQDEIEDAFLAAVTWTSPGD